MRFKETVVEIEIEINRETETETEGEREREKEKSVEKIGNNKTFHRSINRTRTKKMN